MTGNGEIAPMKNMLIKIGNGLYITRHSSYNLNHNGVLTYL